MLYREIKLGKRITRAQSSKGTNVIGSRNVSNCAATWHHGRRKTSVCADWLFTTGRPTLNWVGDTDWSSRWSGNWRVWNRTPFIDETPLISQVPRFVSRHFIWFFLPCCLLTGRNYPAFKCENIPCKMQQIGLPEASRWTQINEYSLRSRRILSCIKRVCFVCRSHMRRGLVHFKAALSFALPLYCNCDLLLAVATVVAAKWLRK